MVKKEVRALKERNKGKTASDIEANHRYTHLGPGQRQEACIFVCCLSKVMQDMIFPLYI